MTSFPSLLGHHTKDLLWFHPTQRGEKLRRTEKARNKGEKQELPISALQWEWPWFLVTLCRQPQQLLPLKEPLAITVTMDCLQISLVFAPQLFAFAVVSCLRPFPLFPLCPHWSLEPLLTASPGLYNCERARCQPRSPQLTPTTMHMLRAVLSSCAFAPSQHDTHHQPPLPHAHTH